MLKLLDRVYKRGLSIFFRLLNQNGFMALGRGTWMVKPFRVDGGEGITIGRNVFFQRGLWLYCCGVDNRKASLSIGSGCVFGYNNHITCVGSVRIGDDVLTANNVYISDNIHGYEDVTLPVIRQPVKYKRSVDIGSGSWIGENACIIGANVGKNSVIGANAVVTSDIPDYAVAVGMPAKVIKQYDAIQGKWFNR